jgi:lactoylglutathione lyase
VEDVPRAVRFYRDIVGLELAYEVPDRGAAFLWAGEPGGAMQGLWSLGTAPMGMRLHVAFAVELDELLSAPSALASAGVTPLSFFGDEANEPSVIGWMPAAAVYFRDTDGHMLEYLAMLDEPPRPDVGITTWAAWTSENATSQRGRHGTQPALSGPSDPSGTIAS